MRYYLTFFILLWLFSCSFGQTVSKRIVSKGLGLFEFYENDSVKIRMNEIVRTDSTYDNRTGQHIYNSFDKLDTLVQELKYNFFQSDTRRAYLTRNLYDRNGKIIIYELFNMEGKRLEGFKFRYNDKRLLTKKEKI